jgi:GAF domain-containing protein
MTAAAITLFDRALAPGETPESRKLAAFCAGAQVIELEFPLDPLDAGEMNRLRTGMPLVLEGADVIHSRFPDDIKAHLDGQSLIWLASFGLRSGEQLLGTLALMCSTEHTLSETEINAYTTLADQIGVVLHSRQLLSESRQAYELTSQLVSTNRAISTSRDYDEMSRIILDALPEETRLASILLFDTPGTTRTLPSSARSEVVATREEILHPAVVEQVGDELTRFRELVVNLLSGDPLIIEDTRQSYYAKQSWALSLNELGVYNLVAVGLQIGGRVLGMLLVGLEEGASFSPVLWVIWRPLPIRPQSLREPRPARSNQRRAGVRSCPVRDDEHPVSFQ